MRSIRAYIFAALAMLMGAGAVSAQDITNPSLPGGSTTQLQYNNAGVFGGISGWTTNGTLALTGGASTTLAVGGATIGTNAFAVTGTSAFGGISSFPLGSRAAPSIYFVGTTIGLWDDSGTVRISGGNSDWVQFTGSTVAIPSSNTLSWNADTSISRSAAGVVQIGTTAANALGSLQAATLALGGATIGSNALAVTGTVALAGVTTVTAGGSTNASATVINTFNNDFTNILDLLAPNTTGTKHVAFNIGVAQSARNLATVTFKYISSGSNSNAFAIFFQGAATPALQVNADATNPLVQIGGETSSFPAIKRSAATIQVRLADDSADADLKARTLGSACTTVAALPAAGTAGRRACVNDQLTTCAGVGIAPTGGGAVVCPVFDNGTIWVGG